MQIKIKKLKEEAVIPSYGTDFSAGLDLTATSLEKVDKGEYGYYEYGTGLAFEIPEGFVGLIYPRSSISKTGHILANSVAVIDSDYRGEVMFRFKTIGDSKEYNVGDKIGQLIVMPYPKIEFKLVDELKDTKRGSGGFGHTGS